MLRHIFRPNASNVALIEEIGNHFLNTRKGWFCPETFHGFELIDRYKKLLGNKNGPFGGYTGSTA